MKIKGEEASYSLKRSIRARKIRLSVHAGGSVVLTLPVRVKESVGEKFVQSKAEWILDRIAHFKRLEEKYGPAAPRRARGKEARVWEYALHKEMARAFIRERLGYWTGKDGAAAAQGITFIYKDVRIKDQKTRWGSCSRKGNLNFNYKLALIDPRLADYVIVHELCHLKEMNHGPKFWKLVGQVMPDYAERRRELRRESMNVS